MLIQPYYITWNGNRLPYHMLSPDQPRVFNKDVFALSNKQCLYFQKLCWCDKVNDQREEETGVGETKIVCDGNLVNDGGGWALIVYVVIIVTMALLVLESSVTCNTEPGICVCGYKNPVIVSVVVLHYFC